MLRKIPRIAIAAIVLLAISIWLAARFASAPRMDAVHPARGQAVQAVYATGTVEATVMMPIASRASARLMELHADEGDTVHKGQAIARLEDEDVQSTMKELQAREAFAQNDYNRKVALAKKNVVSKELLDQARTDLQAAQAAARRATAEASYLTLYAPDDGLIIKRDGEVGQLIPANQPVFWLSCCAPLRISTEVDEEDVPQVKAGQSVLIRADAFPGKIFHGTVQAITPKGDPIARSYRVRVGFTEPTPLQIGMTAETNIMIRVQDNALLLPNSAIKDDKLWLVKDGHATQTKVVTGAKGITQTEIVSGVSENDTVIVKPGTTLKEGVRVRERLTEPAK